MYAEYLSFYFRRLSVATLVICILSLAGCPACEPQWPTCKDDKHCRADKKDNQAGKAYFCIDGKCQECRDVNQCPNPARQKCENNSCVEKTCADITCEENKRCNPASLECEWICQNDGDSPCDGDRCKVCRNHQCIKKEPKCSQDADCPAGQICQNKGDCEANCIAGCSSDKPCPEGQECVGSTCREATCEPSLIYFDFNKHFIRSDAQETLRQNITCFQKMSAKRILIEGHCDERGTRDFNIQLGRRRANTTRDYILRLGIESKRICTVSKGKEEPVVSNASSEDEHQRNRRGVFRFVDSCP